jgi:hypothetical protein
MNTRWTWILGLISAGGTVVSIVLLATDPSRDLISMLVGAAVGATAAACVAAALWTRAAPGADTLWASQSGHLNALHRQVADLESKRMLAAHNRERALDAAQGYSWLNGPGPRKERDRAARFEAEYARLGDEIHILTREVQRIESLDDTQWRLERQERQKP